MPSSGIFTEVCEPFHGLDFSQPDIGNDEQDLEVVMSEGRPSSYVTPVRH